MFGHQGEAQAQLDGCHRRVNLAFALLASGAELVERDKKQNDEVNFDK